ncbi:BppU family phage baseplate upper protein [Clostridium perfringens]
MSEIGLSINVDSYNNEGIKTIKGNNNAEIYKLYILKNKRRLSLVGKTVKLGYVMAGTSKGDIIENLNITNAEQGEITFPITNRISKQDGVYSCQLAIYGADEFLEYTATFGLTVEDNIFTKIAGEIENSKDLTYIERILEEAKTVSGDLKTNIPVATNLNSSLESNISNARNINTTLSDTTEKSKVAATDAIEKKSQLESSITKAKELIEGLDGSQNIPQIRMDVTELQNGLKSNQALAYTGSSISANNTLEGRTEGMKIKGRTLQNLKLDNQWFKFSEISLYSFADLIKQDTEYILFSNADSNCSIAVFNENASISYTPVYYTNNVVKFRTTKDATRKARIFIKNETKGNIDFEKYKNYVLLEADLVNENETINYFEGIKSFGEAEQEGDKYKISILSHNKNFFNINELSEKINEKGELEFKADGNSRINSYVVIFTENKTNSQRIAVLGEIGEKTFTTLNQEEYYIHIGLNGDKKDDKLFRKIVLPKNTTCCISIFSTTENNNTVKFKDVQIEVGTSKTQYEPYKCDKKDILIKEPLREGDIMYEDNGQVKVNRYTRQYNFTGDESWNLRQDASDEKYLYFQYDSDLKGKTGYCLCNNFMYNTEALDKKEFIRANVFNTKFLIGIKILKTKLSTPNVDGFKEWLKANPTTIVYQLATPTVEIVENCVDIDLDTFGEKTYFNIENSIKGSLDFKVPSNIGSVVQNMAKEVNNIWDVINNLLVPSIVKANGNLAMLKLNNNLN